jgi:hypothetical protein
MICPEMGVSIMQSQTQLSSRHLPTFLACVATALVAIAPPVLGKDQKLVTDSVVVNTPPEYVFQAIRKQRDDKQRGRHTLAFDGKVAKIDDRMEGVAIYGKVHTVWEETERPFEAIDYRMLSSDHFKSATGHFLLTPSSDKKTTTLELQCEMDSGLRIPFGDSITRMNLAKDTKERLARLKKWAEDDCKNGVTPATPPIKTE